VHVFLTPRGVMLDNPPRGGLSGTHTLAQYYDNNGSGAAAVFWVLFVVLLVVGAIPASIASGKGYSAAGFYFFGLFFFLPALIVSIFLQPKPGSREARTLLQGPTVSIPTAPMKQAAAPPGPGDFPSRFRSLSPGPGVVRECPHCKEPMRRDASVCPHCRRESPAWEYRDERWWASSEDGGEKVWFDEPVGKWQAASYVPPQPERKCKLLFVSVRGDAKTAAKLIRDGSNSDWTTGALRRAGQGATVAWGLGEAKAEALKVALAEVGMVVEVECEPAR
jgi:hypothetical protein